MPVDYQRLDDGVRVAARALGAARAALAAAPAGELAAELRADPLARHARAADPRWLERLAGEGDPLALALRAHVRALALARAGWPLRVA
ncbi:MAG: hypothetical protein HY908_05515, partial [Myxococcales bacterium]|nr:hypothetical protein [Myxococcales bacterium]